MHNWIRLVLPVHFDEEFIRIESIGPRAMSEVRRLVSDVFVPGAAITRGPAGEHLALWRPLSLAKTVRDVTRSRTAWRLLLIWLTLTVACIVLGIYQVKLAWNALPVHIGPIRFSLTIYPPLVICVWLVFWLGFEWAFLSAYLATFSLLGPATAFLQKPFAPARLAQKLRELLDAPK